LTGGGWRRWSAAGLTALAGTLAIVAQFTSLGATLDNDEFGLPATAPFDRLLAFAGGVAMLVLARGMYRGNRRAADIALAVVLVLGLGRWAAGQGLVDVGLDLGAAGLLALSRDAFPVVRPIRPLLAPGAVAVVSGAFAYALHAGFQLRRPGGTDVDRAVSLAGHVVRGAGHGLVANTWLLAPTGALPVTLDILVAVTLAAAGLTLLALLRPQPGSEGHTPAEHRRAAELVARLGTDSLDPFALRADKSFHFAAGGFLAYRTLRETAVVAGDPIAPPGRASEVLGSFLSYAEKRGWDVVVTAASGRRVGELGALGMRSIPIGEEAVVDPRDFSLAGRRVRKVRQSVTRVARHGWTVETIAGERVTQPLLEQLGALEAEWRSRQQRLYGFAMTLGRLWGAREDSRSLYVIARDADRQLRAFMRFAEFSGGLSLDVMRRASGEQPNGLNEALVVATLSHARELGVHRVSLNFAGLAHIMAADAALSRGQRVLRAVLRRAHGRFQLERLVQFNSKFDPSWEMRYLLYRGRTRLPVAALRVLQAEAYVRPPRTPALTRRWEPAAVTPGALPATTTQSPLQPADT
jgi:lysyl-tRNA synthetase class 2